jgi:hypothetical protein
MAKKETQANRRRFEEAERKPWTEEERKAFLKRADLLAPFVRHLTTPAPAEKKKDPLAELLGLESD